MRTRRKDQEVIFMVFNILSTRELVPVPLQTSRIQQRSQPYSEISKLDICRIHVEEYHEPVFALSSRLFCHL